MRIMIWAALAAASCLVSSSALAKKYSITDLSALEEQSSWAEIVEHLDDVPPSKRTGPWQKICEKATVEYLSALDTDREPFAALMAADGFTKRYPQLKKSAAFMEKRADVGLKGFELCFKSSYSGEECHERLLGFVDADPKNASLALRAGKIVRLNQFAYVAMPYFKRAIDRQADAKACADEDLRLAVVAALGLPPDDPRMKDARALASGSCFAALSDAVMEEFNKNTKGSYYFDNACGFLKAKGKLGELQSKQCDSK
jgi:hypothetical protein